MEEYLTKVLSDVIRREYHTLPTIERKKQFLHSITVKPLLNVWIQHRTIDHYNLNPSYKMMNITRLLDGLVDTYTLIRIVRVEVLHDMINERYKRSVRKVPQKFLE